MALPAQPGWPGYSPSQLIPRFPRSVWDGGVVVSRCAPSALRKSAGVRRLPASLGRNREGPCAFLPSTRPGGTIASEAPELPSLPRLLLARPRVAQPGSGGWRRSLVRPSPRRALGAGARARSPPARSVAAAAAASRGRAAACLPACLPTCSAWASRCERQAAAAAAAPELLVVTQRGPEAAAQSLAVEGGGEKIQRNWLHLYGRFFRAASLSHIAALFAT